MKNKTIQIIQTSDIHGYIFPYHYATMEYMAHGLAKISSLINKYKDENTVIIDSGDTIQGSPFTYVQSKYKKHLPNPLATIMNTIGYQYITIGNHEFNYGTDYLDSYVSNLDATILNCNLIDKISQIPYYGVPYDIKIIDGIRVGIIGATTHYIPNWEQPSHIDHLDIKDAYHSVKQTVKQIRNDVDLLIVSYHGGFERNLDTGEYNVVDTGENQGYKMMDTIDGIDILLTGHQHRSLSGKHKETTYVQPGYNGQSISLVSASFKFDNGKWIKQNIKAEIIKVDDIDSDPNIINLVKSDEAYVQETLDTVVGKLQTDCLIENQLQARLNKHPLVSFINAVQLQYTGADISSCSLGNDVSGFKKDITIRDIIGTYIFPNTLVVKRLTGKVLKEAIEKSAEFFKFTNNSVEIADEYNTPKLQLYAYDMYDNIDYTLDISKPIGSRLIKVLFNGNPVEDHEEFDVVMNNYRASGGGDYLFIKDSPIINDTQMEVVELLIDYISSHDVLKIAHHDNITILPKGEQQ